MFIVQLVFIIDSWLVFGSNLQIFEKKEIPESIKSVNFNNW